MAFPQVSEASVEVTFPERLGQYRLLELRDAGGMGVIYTAKHERLGRLVALKVLSPNRQGQPDAHKRFRREWRAIGALDHPNIVRVIDAGEDGGAPYLVMELIEGMNLARLSHRLGPIPVPEATSLIAQAALGLQHAYENGVLHRDIKPSNLILDQRGVLKILDWGLARLIDLSTSEPELTQAGSPLGTPGFMPPERVLGLMQSDVRSDLYCLGLTLLQLLTGRPANSRANLPGSSISPADQSTVHDVPKLPANLDTRLVAIFGRLLAQKPEERYSTPIELFRDLSPFTEGADLAILAVRYNSFHPSTPGVGSGSHSRPGSPVPPLGVAAAVSPQIFDWETGEDPLNSSSLGSASSSTSTSTASASTVSARSNSAVHFAPTSQSQAEAPAVSPTPMIPRSGNRRRFLIPTALTAFGALLAFSLMKFGTPDLSGLLADLQRSSPVVPEPVPPDDQEPVLPDDPEPVLPDNPEVEESKQIQEENQREEQNKEIHPTLPLPVPPGPKLAWIPRTAQLSINKPATIQLTSDEKATVALYQLQFEAKGNDENNNEMPKVGARAGDRSWTGKVVHLGTRDVSPGEILDFEFEIGAEARGTVLAVAADPGSTPPSASAIDLDRRVADGPDLALRDLDSALPEAASLVSWNYATLVEDAEFHAPAMKGLLLRTVSKDQREAEASRADLQDLQSVLISELGAQPDQIRSIGGELDEPAPAVATFKQAIRNAIRFTYPDEVLTLSYQGTVIRDDFGAPVLVVSENNKDGWLPASELSHWLNEATAPVLFLVDADAAGALRNIDWNAYVIMSCREDQTRAIDQDSGRSVFARWIKLGLSGAADADGDAVIGFDELYRIVSDKVREHPTEGGPRLVDRFDPGTLSSGESPLPVLALKPVEAALKDLADILAEQVRLAKSRRVYVQPFTTRFINKNPFGSIAAGHLSRLLRDRLKGFCDVELRHPNAGEQPNFPAGSSLINATFDQVDMKDNLRLSAQLFWTKDQKQFGQATTLIDSNDDALRAMLGQAFNYTQQAIGQHDDFDVRVFIPNQDHPNAGRYLDMEENPNRPGEFLLERPPVPTPFQLHVTNPTRKTLSLKVLIDGISLQAQDADHEVDFELLGDAKGFAQRPDRFVRYTAWVRNLGEDAQNNALHFDQAHKALAEKLGDNSQIGTMVFAFYQEEPIQKGIGANQGPSIPAPNRELPGFRDKNHQGLLAVLVFRFQDPQMPFNNNP